MNSLKEAYQKIAAADQQVKEASAKPTALEGVDPGLIKKAQDYETVGRIMAHKVFDDLLKEAAPVGHGEGHRHADDSWCDDSCDGYTAAGDEKVAAAKAQIIERMANDPEYLAKLAAKHASKFAR